MKKRNIVALSSLVAFVFSFPEHTWKYFVIFACVTYTTEYWFNQS